MTKPVVRCAECGLETMIDIEMGNIQSLAIPEAEMKRLCKLASRPGFNSNCPYFTAAITATVSPSGKSK
jgi:hypothetical protein